MGRGTTGDAELIATLVGSPTSGRQLARTTRIGGRNPAPSSRRSTRVLAIEEALKPTLDVE